MKLEILHPKKRGSFRILTLTEDYTWQDGLVLPKGFVWNGASVPKPFDRQCALIASCRHDHDYNEIIAMLAKGPSKAMKRRAKEMKAQADWRFKQNMRQLDYQHQFWCWAYYLALRIPYFGGDSAIRAALKEIKNGNIGN